MLRNAKHLASKHVKHLLLHNAKFTISKKKNNFQES